MVWFTNQVRRLSVSLLAISLVATPLAAQEGKGKSPNPDEIKRFQERLEESLKAPENSADPLDSYASDFVSKVWSEPKYRYLAGSIVVGETILSAMLVKRARLNAAQWTRQLDTVKEVSASLKDVATKLAAAEQDVLKSLSALGQADKAELFKSLSASKNTLPALEAALKTEAAAGSPTCRVR